MSDDSLADKVVIVTGGGRGLGRAMTLSLIGAGARVVAAMHIADDIEPLETDARAIPGDGALHAVLADIRHPDACADVIGAAVERFGKLDVLVNNAGMGMLLVSENFESDPPGFLETDPEVARTIFETHVMGPFFMAHKAAPLMIEAGWGRIVNVTTSIRTMQRGGVYPYGPSKAALEASSKVWAEDLDGAGVTVNVLIPGGAVNTDMLPAKARKTMRTGSGRALLEAGIMGPPIRWLASNASDGITGMRFVAEDWDTSLDPSDAAKAASAPVGFDPRP